MKRGMATWAGVGFLVASCWVLYAMLAPPEFLLRSLRGPLVQAGLVTCPILFARAFPLKFWWIPPINAASYAVLGLVYHLLRHRRVHVLRMAPGPKVITTL